MRCHAPYIMGALKIFDSTTATFPEIFNLLLFRSILWMCIQNSEVRSLPVPEIIRVLKYSKIWTIPGYDHALFFQKNFHGILFGWTRWRYQPNLQSIALPVPEIIPIAVLGWGCEPPILGREGHRGSGIVPFERALVTSYRLSIVNFPLSLRV